jgi:hypothetical protein
MQSGIGVDVGVWARGMPRQGSSEKDDDKEGLAEEIDCGGEQEEDGEAPSTFFAVHLTPHPTFGVWREARPKGRCV